MVGRGGGVLGGGGERGRGVVSQPALARAPGERALLLEGSGRAQPGARMLGMDKPNRMV